MKTRTPRFKIVLLCGAVALAAAGCAVMESTRVSPLPPGAAAKEQASEDAGAPRATVKDREGIPYFLPMGKLKVIAEKPKEGLVTITCEEVYLPDPRELYLLKLRHSISADDLMGIAVTNGLLTSVNSTNKDQTGEIILELAKAGIEAMKLAATASQQVKRVRIEETVNPFDDADWKRFVQVMSTFDGNIVVEFSTNNAVDFGAWTESPAGMNGDYVDGFFHRPLMPYTISFRQNEQVVHKTVLLPNAAPILSYNIKRGAFAERVTSVRLHYGSITEVSVNRPSELLAAAKIPYTIIHSLVTLPTDLIQLRIDYTNKKTAENTALVEYLKSQLAVEQARATNAAARLERAMAATNTARTTTTNAPAN